MHSRTLSFAQVSRVSDAEVVLVTPLPHCGSAALEPLLRDAPPPAGMAAPALPVYGADGVPRAAAAQSQFSGWLALSPVRFVYQSMTFHLVALQQQESGSGAAAAAAPQQAFAPLACPDRLALAEYGAWRGWQTAAQVAAAARKWGANAVESPPPTFLALLREQALAPFFAFQMFSVGLWMLDEYWQYALFSLSTLVGMEALQAFQRLQQHRALRSMRPAPSPVYRWRLDRWTRVHARELRPPVRRDSR